MAVPLLKGPFTVADYHRLGEIGILGEDDRVELLDGQIVEMSPIGSRHAGCVKRFVWLLPRLLGDAAMLGVQDPVTLDDHSEPEPDIAVLKPRADTYSTSHPRPDDVLLVIEVADTSVQHDRTRKIPLYARAAIAEAWLVNLPADRIEVWTRPGPDGYADVRMAQRGETLSPLLLDGVTLQVNEILG